MQSPRNWTDASPHEAWSSRRDSLYDCRGLLFDTPVIEYIPPQRRVRKEVSCPTIGIKEQPNFMKWPRTRIKRRLRTTGKAII